jgi:hypothetical protein
LTPGPGADVMILKTFSTKKLANLLPFFVDTSLKIITLTPVTDDVIFKIFSPSKYGYFTPY